MQKPIQTLREIEKEKKETAREKRQTDKMLQNRTFLLVSKYFTEPDMGVLDIDGGAQSLRVSRDVIGEDYRPKTKRYK